MPQDFDDVVDKVHALLQRQEKCTLSKLAVISEAFLLVSTASFCQMNMHKNKVANPFLVCCDCAVVVHVLCCFVSLCVCVCV